MAIKQNNPTDQRPEGDRILDAPLVQIDLNEKIQVIKKEEAWQKSDRNAMTIYKTNGMRIVLVALHKNAELATHTASGILCVQVLEGEITFTTQDQAVHLSKGNMVTLHKDLPHSVMAVQESVFLLTLATGFQVTM